ncbi:cytochrome P450 [Sphingomonas sp.]|uniref:cytochrome P450 n=1 Tax=Sphingomonas sp. TaxID=28214 RepID=UPI003B00D6CC
MAGLDWVDVDDKLTTPSFFTAGQHHELFRQMRAAEPVHWTVGKSPRPYWSVTRHADCRRVLEDAATFSSEHGGIMPPTAHYPSPEQRYVMGYGSNPTMTDPPRHLMMRRPFNKHWAAPMIGRMRDKVAICVDAIMTEVAGRGECDLVEDVAAQLPARFVCELMGVPEPDRDDIRYYCAAFMGAQDPAYQIDGDEAKTQRIMLGKLFDYMLALALERRDAPRDDFTSIAARLEVEEEKLDDRDLGWWTFSFVAAGLETTRNALSVGLYELMRHRDQWDRLRANPSLAPLAAEEIVRWVNPSKYKWRVATADCALADKLVRKGDWVVCWLASANRDEEVFADPQMLDVARDPNPHLAFGAGEHSCIGRHLARLEMQTLLNAVIRLMPDMHVLEEPEWLVSTNHTAFKRLRVGYSPAALTV